MIAAAPRSKTDERTIGTTTIKDARSITSAPKIEITSVLTTRKTSANGVTIPIGGTNSVLANVYPVECA